MVEHFRVGLDKVPVIKAVNFSPFESGRRPKKLLGWDIASHPRREIKEDITYIARRNMAGNASIDVYQ